MSAALDVDTHAALLKFMVNEGIANQSQAVRFLLASALSAVPSEGYRTAHMRQAYVEVQYWAYREIGLALGEISRRCSQAAAEGANNGSQQG